MPGKRLRAGGLRIDYGERSFSLAPGDEFVFGRHQSCQLQIVDDADVGVSRRQGVFTHEGSYWWVRNLGVAAMHHIHGGFGYPIFPGESGQSTPEALAAGAHKIIVVGNHFRYELDVNAAPARHALPAIRRPTLDGERTELFDMHGLTTGQRKALVALCELFLLPANDYDPRVRSYQQAADRLFIDKRTVEGHLYDIRKRVGGKVPLPDEPEIAREELCKFFLANRLIGPSDHLWLEEQLAQDGLTANDRGVRGDK